MFHSPDLFCQFVFIAECLNVRHWTMDSGQTWQQVLYVYMFVTLLECN